LASDADISLERDDQSVVLKSGGSRIVFRTLAIENFPVFREASYPCEFSVKGADLGLLLSRAAPFISNDASRYDLSGIHLSSQVRDGAKVMRAAATNGNQLAAAFLPSPVEGEMPEVIIPKQMVIETMKLLDDASGEVAVSVNHNTIRVVSGSTTIVSKLIDATFPEIERVIPRSNPNILRVDTKAFMRALSIVSVMAERKGIRLVKMDIEQLSMTISSRDTEAGEGVEVLSQGDMEYEGAPLTVAFQSAYLADVAKLCGQTTEFRFADAASPFRAGNPGDDSAIYLAMGARF
jgi:DNA polymerase-3 subunit beta